MPVITGQEDPRGLPGWQCRQRDLLRRHGYGSRAMSCAVKFCSTAWSKKPKRPSTASRRPSDRITRSTHHPFYTSTPISFPPLKARMQPRPRRSNSGSRPFSRGGSSISFRYRCFPGRCAAHASPRPVNNKKAAAHMRCGLLIVIVFCARTAYGCSPGSLFGASASGADGASGWAGASASGCGVSGASSILRMTFAGGSMVSSGWTGISPCSQ